MSRHEAIVGPFFEAYAARMNAALADPDETDMAGLRDAFADYMVGANPNGVFGGRRGGRAEGARPRRMSLRAAPASCRYCRR